MLAEYKDKIEPAKMQALIELSKLKGSVDEVARKADVTGLDSWQQLVSLMDLLNAKKVEGSAH